MNLDAELRTQPPKFLDKARALAHKGVQFPSIAARANLPAKDDDSHSNLSWDAAAGRFVSQPIPRGDTTYRVGLSLSPMRLSLINEDRPVAVLELENVSCDDAAEWLDIRLDEIGLNKASTVKIPYELPHEVSKISVFSTSSEAEQLGKLSIWFDLAHAVLSKFAADKSGLVPGPSPVRCWPHHFDIATYVGLETGDSETTRGIGVGMSAGDTFYDQPYFYVNPWPHLKSSQLPQLPVPGNWHREGFVGAIASAEEILSLNDIFSELPVFVNGAFAIGREELGI